MEQLSGKTVLLFCPKFFGYEQEIGRTLEGFGARVIWFDDRPSNNFLSKALIRINKNFLGRRIRKYYNGIFERIRNEQIDFLLFVNPEAISRESLAGLKEMFPHARTILYMWDSFKNRKQNIELLPLFDSMFTFDPNDARTYKLQFRPLFYSSVYCSNPETEKIYDLLFIGTAHSDRYKFVKRLTQSMKQSKIKLYFYLSSRMLYAARKVVDPDFRMVKYEDISFVSLSHQDISRMMKLSSAILDINHPKQIGLTMRTLETLGVQCKLITTNRDVVNYDFYHPDNILLIDREMPVLDAEFFKKPFVTPDPAILFKYSIKGWATEIFHNVI